MERAARIQIGDPIMSVRSKDTHADAVIEALRRAKVGPNTLQRTCVHEHDHDHGNITLLTLARVLTIIPPHALLDPVQVPGAPEDSEVDQVGHDFVGS